MSHGYPVNLALTSLGLCFLLGAAAPAAPGCSELRHLYSSRVLREVRSAMLVSYAREHARRSEEVLRVLDGRERLDAMIRTDHRPRFAQETGDPRLKHLIASIAANCLPR